MSKLHLKARRVILDGQTHKAPKLKIFEFSNSVDPDKEAHSEPPRHDLL